MKFIVEFIRYLVESVMRIPHIKQITEIQKKIMMKFRTVIQNTIRRFSSYSRSIILPIYAILLFGYQ